MTKRVDILGQNRLFQKLFFAIDEIRLRYERYDGTMSEPVIRLNFDRGDGVAVVVHDVSAGQVILIEQFRYAAYIKDGGWLLELPAGILNAGETPADAMRREILEEIGYQVEGLTPIHTIYPSPGGSTERIFLFYSEVTPAQRITAGGGVLEEHEDIRIVSLAVDEALRKTASGEIVDAKTLIGLQWLALRQQENR